MNHQPFTVEVARDMPAEIGRMIDPYIKEFTPYMPDWCVRLRMSWKPLDNSDAAQCCCRPQYRDANLVVCPAFLNYDDYERRATILHELCHLHTVPPFLVALEMLEALMPKPEDRKFHETMLRQAMERATEDMAQMILRLNGGKP